MSPKRNIDLDEYDEKGRKKKRKRDMSDWQVIKRLLGFLGGKKYKKYLIGFYAVMFIGGILGFLFPYFFRRIVDEGLAGGVSGAAFDPGAFYFWGWILLGTMVVNFILWILQQYLIYYLANTVMHRMRKRLFENLQRLSFDYYDDENRSSGKIISYLTNDVETLHQLIASGLLGIVAQVFQLIGALILMFITSIQLSLISFVVIGCIILIGVPFLLKARQYFVIMRRKVGEVTGRLQESISGSRLIKAFAYEEPDKKRFEKAITGELLINLKVQKLFAAMPGVMMSLLGGGLGVILLVSANLLASDAVSGVGEIFQFLLYMMQFFGPIVGIVMFINEIQNSMSAGERVIKLVDLQPTISNKVDRLMLNEEGKMLEEYLRRPRKTKSKYGSTRLEEIEAYAQRIDLDSKNLIQLVSDIELESKKYEGLVRLSNKLFVKKEELLAICDRYEQYFEPFKESHLDRLKLNDDGRVLYNYLKSKRKAKKQYGEDEIATLEPIAENMSKYHKKIFKTIGSGAPLALPPRPTTEIRYLAQKLEFSKPYVIKLYEKNKKFLDREMPHEIKDLKGHIEFRNVSFSYVSGIPVIKNLSVDIKPGERVAIVGYTGAGKSTIINLLSRFYEIDEGAILIDGHDLRDINIHSLRKKMGTVLQDNYLFSGTVMENIRYGKRSATDQEVMDAAKKVGAHEFITSLPQGYNTEVEERGNLLSIGQKQLIAFARALIRDPPVIILDEATSAVDPYSELIIQQALEVLLKNRTSISIAHRLSTIINSDRILCLKDGEIVEAGSHEELMKIPDGLYRQLYTLQYSDAYKEGTKAKIEG